MIRKAISIAFIGVMFIACSNKTPEQRANELLSTFPLNVGNVTKLDSVIGYQEAFAMRLKADSIHLAIDSFVSERVNTLTALREMGQTEKVDSLARATQSSAIAMAQEALGLRQDANSMEFNNEVDGKPKDFLGYRYISHNDSCEYEIYFDPAVNQILGYSRHNNKK